MNYLTTKQAAPLLGYTDDSWVRELCRKGKIKGALKVGRSWIVPDPPVLKTDRRRRSKLVQAG